jgi:hypothetical protein
LIKHTRGRRLRSRYEIGIEYPEEAPMASGEAQQEVHFRSIEERIQMKHAIYRRRFRK